MSKPTFQGANTACQSAWPRAQSDHGGHGLGLTRRIRWAESWRFPLHAGDVELKGSSVTGLAVHVGARVAAGGAPSEVLVTSTAQMLVPGPGIGFADRGRHTLNGVPDEWQLYAVEHTLTRAGDGRAARWRSWTS